MIERSIVTGLIVSSDYLREIKPIWDIKFLASGSAKRIALWCWEYYNRYNKAPLRDIEGIYYAKIKETALPKEIAEDIEDILNSLSEEYESSSINLTYLLDETRKYFTERRLDIHTETIKALTRSGYVVTKVATA